MWSRWDELGKQAVGQTTVRKGRGNSKVSKSTFCGGFFYLNIVGIHTYIFHNRECDFFKIFFWGGTTLGWGGGHVPSVPPGIYAHGLECFWSRCHQSGRAQRDCNFIYQLLRGYMHSHQDWLTGMKTKPWGWNYSAFNGLLLNNIPVVWLTKRFYKKKIDIYTCVPLLK